MCITNLLLNHGLLRSVEGGVVVSYEDGRGMGAGFALIVVLFILLVIVGTAYIGGRY